MEAKRVEIVCSECGAESWLVREPVYEGFTRVGDALHCAACRHEYASEDDVPYKGGDRPAIFTEADRPEATEVFAEDEKGRVCRYCAHYTVNPFTQWCSRHTKEVEATDFCDAFQRKSETEDDGDDDELARLLR